MDIQEKYKIKDLLHKARVVKGCNLTKKERLEVIEGYLSLKMLGVYNKPEFEGNRKLLDKHR